MNICLVGSGYLTLPLLQKIITENHCIELSRDAVETISRCRNFPDKKLTENCGLVNGITLAF